jgi:hypothetical protein
MPLRPDHRDKEANAEEVEEIDYPNQREQAEY